MNDEINTHNDNEPLEEVAYDEDQGAVLVKKLRAKIATLETEKKEYLDALQRMKADVVNRDKAASDERAKVAGMVKEGILEELLPVLDAFSAAFTGASWEAVDSRWRVGVEYIHSQLLKVLNENGIEEYGKVGDVYDPLVHDCVEEAVPSEGATVSAVVRFGYKMNGRILRAAGVKLASSSH